MEGNGTGVVVRYDGEDCSEIVYSTVRVQPSVAVTRDMLFPSPQAWVAAMPPLAVFTAVMVVVLGRLYLKWKAAQLKMVAETNEQIARMTAKAGPRGVSRQ